MKVLIAGDFCPQHRVSRIIEDGRYETIFDNVKKIISGADYSIVNFECTVTSGEEEPIEKCGPNLQCSERGVEALEWVGFDCVSLANNHFYDYGEKGVKNTLAVCKRYGLDVVGGGSNLQEAAEVFYKRIGDETLAIINCCEHEFSIATEESGGSNPLNPIQQYYAICEAKQQADYVLVIVHGGHEYYQLPSPRMQETYRFFIDAGADAVVNHHQHCYSGYELYHEKPIFYGLGNFCFDNPEFRNNSWNEGYLVMLDFAKTNIVFKLHPYLQCSKSANVKLLQGDLADSFREKISIFNISIQDKYVLESKYQTFLNTKKDEIRGAFSPYSDRFTKALCHRHFIPAFHSKKKKKLLLAYLQCESHYAAVLNYFKKR